MPELRRERPLVYAHRGASLRAPENTMRAFALALEEGADGIELDVRLSSDGVVMVFHDADLGRLAGRSEPIAALASTELRRIDVGGDTIPLLDDVLDIAGPEGAIVNVEIKGDVPDLLALSRAVARVIARRSPAERDGIFVSSFRPEILFALRMLGAPVPLAFLFDDRHTGRLRATILRQAVRPGGVHPHHLLCSPASIARWHSRGWFVNAWTVDSPARARALASAGIDGIITNDPRGVKDAIAAKR